ncbi:MAG TPA: YggS family pyridoxal phosphate-dependent enzyme [Acidobacteriota bacterium]|nr:YggS family pyridoxal phosphate-dependent enzyme [Acidobacteriota bacterium]
MGTIAQNIQNIQERAAAAATSCGRSPEEILILAISKTVPADAILRAAEAGLKQFGENRVQEAEGKILSLGRTLRLEWHLVGHLQSNKAKRAVELFDAIHSIDSIKLASKISQAAGEMGKTQSVLLQVDLGHEETKHGADPSRIREILEAVSEMKGIQLNGLMTIPPFFEDADKSRPFYATLRELRDALESEQPGCLGQKHLSMGMSHDFEEAIREGATIIRIGTAIFGSRQ